MRAFDAVCFDLDDTLCVAQQDGEDLLSAAFDRVGVAPFCSFDDVRAVDVEALPAAETDRKFHEHLYAAAAANVGADPRADAISAVAAATVELRDPTAVSFRPGAREALEYVRRRYPVGLITNGSETTQREKLRALGIADAFETAVFCDPAAGVHPKPDPAPFRRALSDLDAAPECTLYVGDRHGGDVVGAHAAGLRSAWVPHETGVVPAEPDPEPTHRLDGLGKLPEIL